MPDRPAMPAIDLAPPRPARRRGAVRHIRRGAGWLHAVLAAVVVFAVCLQVYLIGAYIFGAGQGALDAHRTVGFTTHGIECLVLVTALVAWLPRTDVLLSLALVIVGTTQVALANAHRWAGGLHPLGAMLVLAIAAVLVQRRVPISR